MNRVVLGARVHSGWAAIVAVSGDPVSPQVVDRRRINIVDSAVIGASQPYHFAENLQLSDAEPYLNNCVTVCERIAVTAIGAVQQELRTTDHRVEACAIVLAAGRPLPDLAGILASHALIHTAEGEFFRQVIRKACETLAIAVTGIRERDLDARAASLFGKNKSRVDRKIAEQGRILGPPWTQDQKLATLAATLVLADLCGHPYSKGPAS